MGYEHQNWETVVINKSKPKPVVVDKHHTSAGKATFSTTCNKPAWKIEQQVDKDDGGPVFIYVSENDAKAIITGRIAKKLSQKQLATSVNMNEKDIKDIESRKAIENKAVLSKIKRFLGI